MSHHLPQPPLHSGQQINAQTQVLRTCIRPSPLHVCMSERNKLSTMSSVLPIRLVLLLWSPPASTHQTHQPSPPSLTFGTISGAIPLRCCGAPSALCSVPEEKSTRVSRAGGRSPRGSYHAFQPSCQKVQEAVLHINHNVWG